MIGNRQEMKEIPFETLGKEFEGELYTYKTRNILLSTDASIYQVEPLALAYPLNVDDVVAAVKFARGYGLSIHPRGAGSGLCGSAIGRGIVLDFSKYMNQLLTFDVENSTFICEPGFKGGELDQILKGTELYFPPAPSSGEYATFGGMYGTNAGGAYSVKYGNVSDYVVDAEIVFADGSVHWISEIAETPLDELPENLKALYDLIDKNFNEINAAYPPVPCNVSGYELRHITKDGKLNLSMLIGGSEGTLAIVTKIKFKLRIKSKHNTLIVAYFDDIVSSTKAAQIALKYNPAGIEIMDKSLLNLAKENNPILKDQIPDGHDNVLMIELDGDNLEELEKSTHECMEEMKSNKLSSNISLAITNLEKERFWAVRKSAVPILYLLKGERKIIPLIEDAAIPSDRLVEYVTELYSILEKYNIPFVMYGHIAKGLLHTRPLLDLKDISDVLLLKKIADDVFELVMKLSGTISGEHGDGRIRTTYVRRQYGDVYRYFLEVKKLLDPRGTLNPEIITYEDEAQIEKNLRFGANYKATAFDENVLIWEEGHVKEIEKCHGCSKCTTVTTATRMCPTYKATRDEASSPKAKGNILRALISGRIDSEDLYSRTLQDIIARCIGCGSCSIECPSQVNIPKLAMEARSHYVNKYGAPLEAKIVTNFEMFARYTRKFFPIVTPMMKLKPLRKVVEKIGGVSAEREFVKFETRSIYDRQANIIGKFDKKALYFVGCYSSYIRPQIAESTIRLLNHMGYQVHLPDQNCCGIPHGSKGMAEEAGDKITSNITNWGHLLEEVDCIVVSCSSCALSLTKEWSYFLGGEIIKKIEDKTVHISKLINDNIDVNNLDAGNLKLAYHQACHMKLLPDSDSSIKMLSSPQNINFKMLDSGCCGMAGSWGISVKNYNESMLIGQTMNNALNASGCSICVTDCPTCEMQLKHMSKAEIMHPAEIVDRFLLPNK